MLLLIAAAVLIAALIAIGIFQPGRLAAVRGVFDRVPAAVRDFALALLGFVVLGIAAAVQAHGGILGTGIDWGQLIHDTVNAVALALASLAVLALTPLTEKYGLFKASSQPSNVTPLPSADPKPPTGTAS